MRVDLPLPVPPIMAVVCPGMAVKEIPSRTFSSESGYAKATFLNSSIPFCSPSAGSFASSGSSIEISVFSTSPIRFIETAALGSITKSIVTNMKLIITCIAY